MKLININYLRSGRRRRGALPAACWTLLLALSLIGAAPASAASQPSLQVRLASEGDSGYLGAKTQPAFPGSPTTYLVRLRNVGDQADHFLITGTASGTGFAVSYSDGVSAAGFSTELLNPGASFTFSVQVAPAALPLGVDYRVTVQAASSAAQLSQVITDTVSCSSSAAVVLSAPPDGFGPPGSVVNYPYTVTNAGNSANSFTLSLPGPAAWPGAIFADNGAGGGVAGDGVRQPGETTPSASTGVLAPGATYRFFVEVAVPPGSTDGARADTRVLASGAGDPVPRGEDQVTTSAVASAVSVAESVRNLTQGGAFAPGSNAVPGDTLEYRMSVTNSGSLPATLVGISSAVPTSTVVLPASLRVDSSPAGEGGACPAALCGWVRQASAGIVAHLGQGASEEAGGSLAPRSTLYVFFRVQVE